MKISSISDLLWVAPKDRDFRTNWVCFLPRYPMLEIKVRTDEDFLRKCLSLATLMGYEEIPRRRNGIGISKNEFGELCAIQLNITNEHEAHVFYTKMLELLL